MTEGLVLVPAGDLLCFEASSSVTSAGRARRTGSASSQAAGCARRCSAGAVTAFSGEPGGHFGRTKTGSQVLRLAFWVGQDVNVAEYVRSCQTYHRAKAEHGAQPGFLHPPSVP